MQMSLQKASARPARQVESEVAFGNEAGAGASRRCPAHLSLDLAHSRNGDRQPLADAQLLVGLDPASLVGEIGELCGGLASIGAMQDGIDLHRMALPAPCCRLGTLHTVASHTGAVDLY